MTWLCGMLAASKARRSQSSTYRNPTREACWWLIGDVKVARFPWQHRDSMRGMLVANQRAGLPHFLGRCLEMGGLWMKYHYMTRKNPHVLSKGIYASIECWKRLLWGLPERHLSIDRQWMPVDGTCCHSRCDNPPRPLPVLPKIDEWCPQWVFNQERLGLSYILDGFHSIHLG